ncbi:MAG: nuclear transport factor 2 family protein [Acidimicrobiales bacterium]
MQTEATRQLVQRFLEARAAYDAATIDGLLADDAVWAPPKTVGIGPFEGRETCVKALTGGAIGKIFDMSTLKRTVTKLLADGDTAVALQHLSATTVKGEAYENDYCWVYTCKDGKISRLDEYTDTLHAGRIMGFAKS